MTTLYTYILNILLVFQDSFSSVFHMESEELEDSAENLKR